LLPVVELRWGPGEGPGTPERPGGPRETSVFRGFKEACKRPPEIGRWSPIIYRCFIAICKCFLYWNCCRKTF